MENNVVVEEKSENKIYLEDCTNFNHCEKVKCEIPYFFDRHSWKNGETYHIQIGHIYDPSKFWVVIKEREIYILQAFLSDFYSKKGSKYKLPIEAVKKDIYCVVYTENAYFRGLIVNIPYSATFERKATVFLLDFGYIVVTNIECLYYFYENLYQVPQFAVRASLSGLEPYNTPTWTYKAVKRFNELVFGKVLLCVLKCTDPTRKAIEISIGEVNEFSQIIDLCDILVNEKLARSIILKKDINIKDDKINSRYVHKTKYPYLFPPFEVIECGVIPSCIYTSEMLKQCRTNVIIYKPYYTASYGVIAEKQNAN